MNGILDDILAVKNLDSKNMLGSIEQLESQFAQMSQLPNLDLSDDYKTCNKILVIGMGGSALGAHVIKSLYFDTCKIPLEIVNDYRIPAWVDNQTLVIASSYSGTTEEVLCAVESARQTGARITGVTKGDKLGEWFEKNNFLFVKFEANSNPCGSPRMGLGYSIAGIIIVLRSVGVLSFLDKDWADILTTCARYNNDFGLENNTTTNGAKMLAGELTKKSVWVVGAEHLCGNAHIFANQLNENAKRLAGYFLLPEMNHHLLEGTLYPESNKKEVIFLFLESDNYDERIKKRIEVTKSVLEKNNIAYSSYNTTASSRMAELVEILVLSSYVSFYSAMLQGIDPTAIPFVDFLKQNLSNKGR